MNGKIEKAFNLLKESKNQVFGGVDIIKIACDLGLEVETTSDCSSFFNAEISYNKSTEKFTILVNDTHSRNRVRFSIAHEIAHYLLHEEQIKNKGVLARSLDGNSIIEEEADLLAGKLLIPNELLESFLVNSDIKKEQPVLFEKVGLVANYFRVSLIVATIRLRNLGYNVPYISFAYMG